MLSKNIVPVVFMAGTGGHFLSSFLKRAKLNTKHKQYCLSYYGNCHKHGVDLCGVNELFVDFENNITILRNNIKLEDNIVYYPPFHTTKIQQLLQVFERCIKITYNYERDSHEIAKIFCIKWGIEEGNLKRYNLSMTDQINGIIGECFNKREYFLFDKTYQDKILAISWHELFHSVNTDKLVQKCSDFTNIPKDNFDTNFLKEWRLATRRCLDFH